MNSRESSKKSPAFDHFGLLAPFYERFIHLPDNDTLLELMQPEKGHSLLDVGGGTGRYAKRYTSLFTRTAILDASQRMLAQAGKHKHLFPTQGKAEAMPFGDHVFDRIIAVDSFHHFQNRMFASQELLRLLAPSGRLIIEEPDIRRLSVKFIALGETLLLMRSHFQPPERIRQYFEGPDVRVQLHVNASPNFWLIIDKL